MQQHFDLIPHKAQGTIIYQRPKDGYINATAMCQAAGKEWSGYRRLATSADYLAALESVLQINRTDLVQSISGGDPRLQGTWVHPQVAINLAQWCSAEFAVKVSQWVYDWMSGKGKPAQTEMPYHLRRYVANQQNVPVGHFSILTELTQALIAPLEIMGYTLPEHMVPDISHGLMFCKWLRAKGVDTDALPKYWHLYEDGRRIQAKAYPESLLADWRRHFREEWLPLKAIEYFKGRDSVALQYLPKLLPKPRAA
ncbi:KilA-N domain-containing protein [Mesorhizobium sp.]|uniref:KilA-N domain-containing protein n=1 Tax=Mesorhizobium sp. TaxID=1871066 RepID=UPI000FE6F971|nr:KilA-N domain-containing protein [Mesorhizobium sp.]RWQ65428.1 MAG: KilA-N domain-containing protein [Mesorhizobium sp.]